MNSGWNEPDWNWVFGRMSEEIYNGIATSIPTKRELFAVHALQGLLAGNRMFEMSDTLNVDITKSDICGEAVRYADSLISALESIEKGK